MDTLEIALTCTAIIELAHVVAQTINTGRQKIITFDEEYDVFSVIWILFKVMNKFD